MIQVRFDSVDSERLLLVVDPPEKRDLLGDPAAATEWLFAILGAPTARAGEPGSADQSTQPSPESR